jgi:hypothetical protein
VVGFVRVLGYVWCWLWGLGLGAIIFIEPQRYDKDLGLKRYYIILYQLPRIQIDPPGIFTCFYGHVRRLPLEKYYVQNFLEVPTDILNFNHFRTQMPDGRFTSETTARSTAASEVKHPLRNRFGCEAAKNYDGGI